MQCSGEKALFHHRLRKPGLQPLPTPVQKVCPVKKCEVRDVVWTKLSSPLCFRERIATLSVYTRATTKRQGGDPVNQLSAPPVSQRHTPAPKNALSCPPWRVAATDALRRSTFFGSLIRFIPALVPEPSLPFVPTNVQNPGRWRQ